MFFLLLFILIGVVCDSALCNREVGDKLWNYFAKTEHMLFSLC